jgi:hypothetical protein
VLLQQHYSYNKQRVTKPILIALYSRLTIFVLLASMFSSSLTAKEIIGSYYIPGLVEDNESGLFVKLHKKIMERVGIAYDLQIMPTKRVQFNFKHNKLNSYFPELWEKIPKQREEVVASESIWLKKVILYSLKKAPIKSLSIVTSEHILGAVKGYSYGSNIVNNLKLNIDYVNNDNLNIERLNKGHIDAILGDNASTLNAIRSSGKETLFYYDLQKPVAILDVFYICQNTEKGRALCDSYSQAIRQLKRENIIQLNYITGDSHINL